MHALCVFAHQDDEIAMATRIRFLLGQGARVSCVFLTNGQGLGVPSHIRDEESRRVLTRLGVTRMHFLGSEHAIPDGALVEHLDRALSLLESQISERVDEVYCLAWEGGHADHDASHLVAVTFASRRGILDRCYEMPLYQGRVLFQTLAPLRLGSPWTSRAFTLREGLLVARLCWVYTSQRRSWLGLLPTALIRLVLMRRESTRRVDVARLRARPHEGRWFYERRFGVRWYDFERHARAFMSF